MTYHFCVFGTIRPGIAPWSPGPRVNSPDRDADYFDIAIGVLQGDTLSPYLFIICLNYVLRTSIDLTKKKDFKLAKKEV